MSLAPLPKLGGVNVTQSGGVVKSTFGKVVNSRIAWIVTFLLAFTSGFGTLVTIAAANAGQLSIAVLIYCVVGYVGLFAILAAAVIMTSYLWGKQLPQLSDEESKQAAVFLSRVGDHEAATGHPTLVAVGAYAIQLSHTEGFARRLEFDVNQRLASFVENCRTESQPGLIRAKELADQSTRIANDMVTICGHDPALSQLPGEGCPTAAEWEDIRRSFDLARSEFKSIISTHLLTFINETEVLISSQKGLTAKKEAEESRVGAARTMLVQTASEVQNLLQDRLRPMLLNLKTVMVPAARKRFNRISRH